MPDLFPSYRTEPDAEFADRLEWLLAQRLGAPSRCASASENMRVRSVIGTDTLPITRRHDQDGPLIDLDPSDTTGRPRRRRFAAKIALGIAATAVLAIALAALIRFDDEPGAADGPPRTFVPPPTTAVAPIPQRAPVEGSWTSTDLDGSSQAMVIARSGADFEVVVHDDAASVCSGAPSIMTANARLDADGALILPQPMLRCVDGTTPVALDGSPLADLLRDLTFLHHPLDDSLTDSLGSIWARAGSDGGETVVEQPIFSEQKGVTP